MSHTKTPWRQTGYIVRDYFGDNVAVAENSEYAAFIVRAVNNHDALVSTVKTLLRLRQCDDMPDVQIAKAEALIAECEK